MQPHFDMPPLSVDLTKQNMDFSSALHQLRLGYKVQRVGWNGKGMWIALQNVEARSKMTLPYIYMKTAEGNLVPWLASQTDILAADWQVVFLA